MPRPKRTKVAPSVPAMRVTNNAAPMPLSSEDLYGVSDRETSTAPVAISKAESRVPHNSRPQRVVNKASAMNEEHAKALENLKKRRDLAMQKLEAENAPATEASSDEHLQLPGEAQSSSPAIEIGRRERAPPAVENPFGGPFRRRARQGSILGRPGSRARSSSVEVDLPDEDRGRVENSALKRGTFKRRERQPSILGRREYLARSSSEGPAEDASMSSNTESAMKPGIFKRRSRQPSIPGTANNSRRTRQASYGVRDDFSPDDESTPLKLRKNAASKGSPQAASSANSRKRKMTPIEVSSPTPSPDEISTNGDESPAQSSPHIERPRDTTPEILSETMAPPQSSSPPAPSPLPLQASRRANIQPDTLQSSRATRRQPSRQIANDDPPSSPPSLTYSPDRPTAANLRQRKVKPQPASFSTADLQALLPRRRRRAVRDSFDILSSEASDENDELSHVGTTRVNRRTPAPSRRVTRLRSAAKSTGKTKPSKSGTYGNRQATSDKENENGDYTDDEGADAGNDSLGPLRDASPEDSQELEARVGKELKDAKRKFEDVDKWELDFEDVTASSSSPVDAR